jgi:serine/threonine protein kinase
VTVLAAGVVLADFRIESVVARGGMGVVYRAEQLSLGRPVALKLIAAPLAQEEGFRERFVRESRLAASVDHPHVVSV